MSSKTRTRTQVARDKAALKRLQKSGTYSGKIDLRKAPSRYQIKKIEELRAARPKPKNADVPGVKVRNKEISARELQNLKEPRHKLTTYALPFLRKGQDEPEWRRFTFMQLRKFMAEYKPDDAEGAAEWMSYAVREEWTFETTREVKDMRRDVNVYFSGVRILEPKGEN